ncbi:MAG: polyprenyl diphosphate synthase [bacterium]|nr:polyprenyl diphosphate synthase [bacterium]
MTIPNHLVLIPDGNRRWARAHNLPAVMGHRQVVEKVFPKLVKKAITMGISYFTIWGFSTENWQRSQEEIDGLLQLFDLFFDQYGQRLDEQDVRIVCIGRRDNLEASLLKKITTWEEKTKNNKKMQLTIAFNYGGRDEIVRAINKILSENKLKQIDEANFAQYLDTAVTAMPDPDLIIRTSGEQRLSGLMSWQAAYSELYFSQKTMPEWTEKDLEIAIDDFQQRERRYGK